MEREWQGRSAAAPAWWRRGTRSAACGEDLKFALQFAIVFKPGCRELALADRLTNSTPRFLTVLAVTEAAVAGEGFDILEGRFDALLEIPQLNLAHPWGIDDQCAIGESDQFAVAGGMLSTIVSSADVFDLLTFFTKNLVEEGRFPDAG